VRGQPVRTNSAAVLTASAGARVLHGSAASHDRDLRRLRRRRGAYHWL